MKKILWLAIVLVLSLSVSIPVHARTDKCGESGCGREKTGNGTIYCDVHAAAYVREQGYKVCLTTGCYRRRQKDSSYCHTHICDYKNCTKKATSSDGKYCATHTPKKTEKKVTKKYSPSKKTTKKKSASKSVGWESYDAGYDDIYFDDDFDWDRYFSDDEYATGVDDAMDDLDW